VVTDDIVVSGSAGFIGSHLTDRLLAHGHPVVAVDSFEDYFSRAINEANLKGERAIPAFTLYDANVLELAAEAASRGSASSGGRGAAPAALLQWCACVCLSVAQAGARAS
jgi:nucleoside-diphosphate-sugar epimerase